jgi:hypothetical protein
VYLPDVADPVYQDLLAHLEQELTYTFGGCTTIRGLEGSYLSRTGAIMPDRINLIYTDAPLSFDQHSARISRYADILRRAAFAALDEEVVLVVAFGVWHAD